MPNISASSHVFSLRSICPPWDGKAAHTVSFLQYGRFQCVLNRLCQKNLAAEVAQPLPGLLSDLLQVGQHQQHQHRQEQQGGDGVDLRTHPLLGHAVDGHGQGGVGRAGGEVGDDEVVNGHGEGDERPGDDAGLDLRQHHLPEGLHPGTAQVLGRIHQVAVHLPQLGGHVEDHIGDVEGYMGQQQGGKAQHQPVGQLHRALDGVEPPGEGPPALKEGHEKQAQGYAGDDVGVHHGDVVHREQGVPLFPAQAVQADGGKGARRGGDGGGQQRNQQGGVDALHNQPVLEQLIVPVEGEPPPHGAAVPGVEGEHDEQENGQIQKQEGQADKEAAADTVFCFTGTRPPSWPWGRFG